MKIIIFEIVHEDALYLKPDIIWSALHRTSDYTYIFEKMVTDKNTDTLDIRDQPIIVEGALAYTKYKLQNQFYDDGSKKWIVNPKYRYANYISFAAMLILAFTKKYLNHGAEFKDYVFYLNRTCSSKDIPEPIHRFKVGTDDGPVDITALKTGLTQNDWSMGYRKVVGEHMSYKNISKKRIWSTPVECSLNMDEHRKDFELFISIFNNFKIPDFKIDKFNMKLIYIGGL